MNAFPVRVGIIQSCYVPWRGFFDFIADVDLFVLFDDVQYPTGRSWRNRNRLKTGNGLRWVTVPVPSGAGRLPIDHVPIARSPKPWQNEHRATMERAFATARYRTEALAIWEESISFGDTHLSQLNERLIRRICAYLDINTPIVQARSFAARAARGGQRVRVGAQPSKRRSDPESRGSRVHGADRRGGGGGRHTSRGSRSGGARWVQIHRRGEARVLRTPRARRARAPRAPAHAGAVVRSPGWQLLK